MKDWFRCWWVSWKYKGIIESPGLLKTLVLCLAGWHFITEANLVLLSVSFLPFHIFQILDFPFPQSEIKKKKEKENLQGEPGCLKGAPWGGGITRQVGIGTLGIGTMPGTLHWCPVNSYPQNLCHPQPCHQLAVSSGKSGQSWGPLVPPTNGVLDS